MKFTTTTTAILLTVTSAIGASAFSEYESDFGNNVQLNARGQNAAKHALHDDKLVKAGGNIVKQVVKADDKLEKKKEREASGSTWSHSQEMQKKVRDGKVKRSVRFYARGQNAAKHALHEDKIVKAGGNIVKKVVKADDKLENKKEREASAATWTKSQEMQKKVRDGKVKRSVRLHGRGQNAAKHALHDDKLVKAGGNIVKQVVKADDKLEKKKEREASGSTWTKSQEMQKNVRDGKGKREAEPEAEAEYGLYDSQ